MPEFQVLTARIQAIRENELKPVEEALADVPKEMARLAAAMVLEESTREDRVPVSTVLDGTRNSLHDHFDRQAALTEAETGRRRYPQRLAEWTSSRIVKH